MKAAQPVASPPPMPVRWGRVRNLLAVRLDNLGDVLMTSPALAALRESLPEARLTLLASPAGARLAPHLPMLDAALEWRAPWVKQPDSIPDEPSETGCAERRLIDRIAEHRFDAAIVFTTCTQSALPAALACRLAGIPLRLAHSRENPYRLLTDWVPDPDVLRNGMRHEAARQLALVASVGCRSADERLRFEVGAAASFSLPGELRRAGLEPRQPYIVIHPGASAPSRRWPAERFGAAADRIAARTGHAVVFSGDAGEQPLVEAARAAMTRPAVSLAGRLDLGQLGALIEGADLLIANNTGPVHIAAALGTPVVDLYALTNPQHTPWRVASRVLSHDVPCRNCLKSVCPLGHHDCLRGVEPEAVVAAAIGLLAIATTAAGSPSRSGHGRRRGDLPLELQG
jgi:lipopolysaccharide heptosyltransferase II